jgi:hypothetical protein
MALEMNPRRLERRIYQMVVTKRRESEPYSSSTYIIVSSEESIVDFKIFNGGESINREVKSLSLINKIIEEIV